MRSKLNCYISSPSSFDLTRLEDILDNQDIEHHSFYDFSIGTTFSDLIRRKIRDSDFVIAILQSEHNNVLYELGIAEGLGKPTFILVDKNLKVPFFLDTKFYYQTNFTDLSLIELAIKNFVLDIGNRKKIKSKKNDQDTLSINNATTVLARLSTLRKNPNELEIIELLKQMFADIDVQNVSISNSAADSGIDLVIRSVSLKPYVGSPIFVQVKVGNLNPKIIAKSEEYLMKFINETDAKGAMILYLDVKNKRFDNQNTIYKSILLFDIEDFIHGIASYGLERTLIEQRNKAVHGNL